MSSIFTCFQKDKVKNLAIGCFDGMHLAHMQLVKQLDDNGILLIIDKKYTNFLCSNDEKSIYADKKYFIVDFENIKNLDGKDFLKYIKNEFKNLEKIVVGYDFKFGKDKKYSAFDIEKLISIKTIIIDEIKINNISLHSSKIKEFLLDGDIKNAILFLGRKYSIKAKLIKGQGIGKKELFATLNLQNENYFLPKDGVYSSHTKIKNKLYKSISFLGIRSTDSKFSIESHILDDFDDEVSINDEIELIFDFFIRENIKFDNLKSLKEQIQKDIMVARSK